MIDALHEAVDHGVFGYPGGATESYLDAVTGWQAKRFGWVVPRKWILQTAGIITTLKTAVQAFSAPGDSILIQPPVYAHFHDDVRLNGRHLAYAPLERVENGYRFNAKVFEDAIRPDTKLFILCHPHNPTGNVWSEDELRTMGEICARHGVASPGASTRSCSRRSSADTGRGWSRSTAAATTRPTASWATTSWTSSLRGSAKR